MQTKVGAGYVTAVYIYKRVIKVHRDGKSMTGFLQVGDKVIS